MEIKEKKIKTRKLKIDNNNIPPIQEELIKRLDIDINDIPQENNLPSYNSKFKGIIEDITNIDPEKEYRDIEKWLEKKATNLAEATELMNEHPSFAQRARTLAQFTKKEFENFEMVFKKRTFVLRKLSRGYWENEKRGGMRKAITKDMIEDWIIENYGNVYIPMRNKLSDIKMAYEIFDKLASKVEMRDADIRRMYERYSQAKYKPNDFARPGILDKDRGQKKNE